MSEDISEWVSVSEEEYDTLIPVYKKRFRKLQIVRYVILAAVFAFVVFLNTNLVFSIIVFGLGVNLFIWLSSQQRILSLQIQVMDNIRKGTIDQFLE